MKKSDNKNKIKPFQQQEKPIARTTNRAVVQKEELVEIQNDGHRDRRDIDVKLADSDCKSLSSVGAAGGQESTYDSYI